MINGIKRFIQCFGIRKRIYLARDGSPSWCLVFDFRHLKVVVRDPGERELPSFDWMLENAAETPYAGHAAVFSEQIEDIAEVRAMAAA